MQKHAVGLVAQCLVVSIVYLTILALFMYPVWHAARFAA
jgi:hypothetical protein